jgi:ketosteroid isomerase-like protein
VEHDVPYGNPAARTEAVGVVRAIYDAFARRDVEAALAYLSPDVEWRPAGTSSLTGRAEPYRGHDGIREYFADAERTLEDLRLFAEDIRVAGGGVVVFGHVEGRVRGEPFRSNVVWTWQVRDGLAVAMRVSTLG